MTSTEKKHPLVAIVGPTAVGKTELSLKLAETLDGEIISADSRLFYRGMNIGTAKPSEAEMARVPHHLIDVATPDEIWSLGQFQQAAKTIIAKISKRGKLPFLVGGTGQYIRAVTEGWQPPKVRANPRLREILEGLAREKGTLWLHARLAALDPAAAEKIDYRNLRRTIRALEVIFSSGQRFSSQRRQRGSSPYALLTIGLKRPRAELYARVDARIEQMFARGLLDEVQTLLDAGYPPELPSMSALGYRECVAVLRGEISQAEAIAEMKRVTRVFVRKQANWFKEADDEIRWFDAGDTELFVQVLAFIQSRLQK